MEEAADYADAAWNTPVRRAVKSEHTSIFFLLKKG